MRIALYFFPFGCVNKIVVDFALAPFTPSQDPTSPASREAFRRKVGKSKPFEVFVEDFPELAVGVVAADETGDPLPDATISDRPGVPERPEMSNSVFNLSGARPVAVG